MGVGGDQAEGMLMVHFYLAELRLIRQHLHEPSLLHQSAFHFTIRLEVAV